HVAQDSGHRRCAHPALQRPREPAVIGDLLPHRPRRCPGDLRPGHRALPCVADPPLLCGGGHAREYQAVKDRPTCWWETASKRWIAPSSVKLTTSLQSGLKSPQSFQFVSPVTGWREATSQRLCVASGPEMASSLPSGLNVTNDE